jgi:hypothetical protein
MDPISLLKTLWRYWRVVLPVVLLTVAAAFYVFTAQRTYTAEATYALMAPKVPTEHDIEVNPALGKANSDNPYLRSPDGLLSQVLITKLSVRQVASSLEEMGLSGDYAVTPGASGAGIGFILQIQATGTSPSQSMATVDELGRRMSSELYSVQKVNGADDSYLMRAQVVQPADSAQEAYSTRLRSIIVLAVAGVVVLFGAVSVARSFERRPRGRRVHRSRRKPSLPPVETVDLELPAVAPPLVAAADGGADGLRAAPATVGHGG